MENGPRNTYDETQNTENRSRIMDQGKQSTEHGTQKTDKKHMDHKGILT